MKKLLFEKNLLVKLIHSSGNELLSKEELTKLITIEKELHNFLAIELGKVNKRNGAKEQD